MIDPWADDARLREANPATRVPTLITDEGIPLTVSLLVVQWLKHTRPAPDWPGFSLRRPVLDAASAPARRLVAVAQAAPVFRSNPATLTVSHPHSI